MMLKAAMCSKLYLTFRIQRWKAQVSIKTALGEILVTTHPFQGWPKSTHCIQPTTPTTLGKKHSSSKMYSSIRSQQALTELCTQHLLGKEVAEGCQLQHSLKGWKLLQVILEIRVF